MAIATAKKMRRHPAKQRNTVSKPATVRKAAKQRAIKTHAVQSFSIVGVGASAGGLDAFTQLITHLPADTGMAFVLIQHLDPEHESALAQILSRATSMPVTEAQHNQVVKENAIYIIPPHSDLIIERRTLKLQPRGSARAPKRTIDAFFESLAHDVGGRAIGVILSGTGSDGALGLEAIKAEGGITFAQDHSAKYDSMPKSAIAAGCVDYIASPERIGDELARIAKHPSLHLLARETSAEIERAAATANEHTETPLPSGGKGSPDVGATRARHEAEQALDPAVHEKFKKIVLLLREHSGVDFSLYKSSTIVRRIARRMVLNKQDTPDAYAGFLKGNADELDALYSDVLISVTNFFRDPAAFDVLQRKVFKKVKRKREDPPYRVWVLGCSTGQEAYSLAMSYIEATETSSSGGNVQVFATDLNESLLDKARQGLYSPNLVHDISPERLKRFFIQEQGGYRVVKSLRERVVFARQNVMSDPPFSRMDLISCRNLLIYLEPNLQRKVFPSFHYALQPNGTLFLGSSESISGFSDLFEPLDKKHKLFTKKVATSRLFRIPTRFDRLKDQPTASKGHREGTPAQSMREQSKPLPWAQHASGVEITAQREADRVTVNQFAPPGVLIDAELRILQFRGATSAFLEPPTGKASFDLLKMAREGLMIPLRAAIAKAKKENKPVQSENVRVRGVGTRPLRIAVIPLRNLEERCFLVLFQAESARYSSTVPEARAKRNPKAKPSSAAHYLARIAALEAELAETSDYLQSVHDQQELVNSELQASNEEVQSSNEELQSVNEELETSKEELESSNEELITINEELANRNNELSRLNSDLTNLQAATKLSIVLLGRDLRIRRFSAQAEKEFHLLTADIGRPIGNIRHDLEFRAARKGPPLKASDIAPPDSLEELVSDVIANVREREHEVQDRDGRWHSIRVRPYLSSDNQVDGAVLVSVDIDSLKRSERATKTAKDYAEAILRTARDPLIVLRGDLRVNTANEAFYHYFSLTPGEVEGHLIFELAGGAWRISELRVLLEGIVPRNSFFNDMEISLEVPKRGVRRLRLNARRMTVADADSPGMILLTIEDVTERQRAQKATAELAAIVETTEDAVFIKSAEGMIKSWNRGAERMLGYHAEEIVGRHVSVFGASHADIWPLVLAKMQRGQTVTDVETEWLTNAGRRVAVSVSAAPLKTATGELTGASIIARDISLRKRAQGHVELLAELGKELLKLTTLEQIVRVIGTRVAEHMEVDLCAIVETDKLDRMTRVQAWQPEVLAGQTATNRLTILQSALAGHSSNDEPYLVRNTREDPHADAYLGAKLGAVLAVPLSFDDRWHYFFCVAHSEGRAWRDDEIQLLRDLCVRVCVRLERLRSEDALRMSEERYYMLFESIDEGFCILEKMATEAGQPIDFQYIDVNPAFYLQSGLTNVVGSSIRQVIQEEAGEWIPIFDGILQTGESLRMAREFRTRSRILDMYAFRIEDATMRRVAIIFKDITERHQLEVTTKEQAETLVTLDRRKDEFLAMLSHELRNPLAPISNAVRILLQLPVESALHQRACKIIERQVSQLTHLIDDLMEVSRITTGRVQLRTARVSLGEIVERAVDTLRPSIDQQKQTLTLSVPSDQIWIDADPARIEQVIVNLLGNAVKYTDKGGELSLSVSHEGGEAVIRVQDTGIGIPAELMPHIFDLFTQGERSLDRSRGGLGIGLALVRRLVELHRGSVEVRSPGKGSEFTVRLPAAEAPALAPSVAAQTIHELDRPLRVLIVDDVEDEVESLSMLMKTLGHQVETAVNGSAALAAARQHRPDVVLLDIGLPGINGYEVARSLRSHADNESITIVAITGYGQRADIEKTTAAGFDHHLVKPADFSTLKAILNETSKKIHDEC